MRRVKNVEWDGDDGWGDDDWGGGWGEGGYPAAAKAKGKAKAKGGAAPKAKGGAAPKAAAPKAKSNASSSAPVAAASKSSSATSIVVEELSKALGCVSTERVESAVAQAGTRPEDAFLSLLAEELEAGRWQDGQASSVPATEVKIDAATKKVEAVAKSTVKIEKATSSSSGPAPDADEKEEELVEAMSSPAADAVADSRPSISLVVVGHVDAGKSTLMGHLLCLVGNVTQKQMHKFEKESKEIGKASFAYAWVLDEGEDERARGVTIDVCVKHFSTETRRFTILDAPGHRDFVPNMLQGAVQADVALLVADTSHFEAGFDRGGQTKEHLQLVRSLGIAQLIVAVNKLDTHDWKQEVFEDIKAKLHAYITGPECGFKAANVTYIPLSGFTGENMLERKEAKLSWWEGPTLIGAFDQLEPPKRAPAGAPLRMPIADVYRSGANSCLSGKVEAGTMTVGQKVLVLPSGEVTTVKGMQAHGNVPVRGGFPGEYMDGVILPLETNFCQIGGVLCDPKFPVPCVDAFQAQILCFDLDIPLMRGQQLMCYLHTETLSATIVRLDKLIVKGKPQDKRPKCLQKGNVGIVSLSVNRKVCIEAKSAAGAPTSLGRLVLRDKGRTVAAGVILSTA